jgi:hypothetical protein
MQLWGSGFVQLGKRLSGRPRIVKRALPVAMATMTLLGLAQVPGNAPNGPPHPLLSPAINPTPDANDQLAMRERKTGRKNFDAANAERLRQMTQATQMLETMAIALKAEVDNAATDGFSESAVRKAETIEKLAQIVKERMKLTAVPD